MEEDQPEGNRSARSEAMERLRDRTDELELIISSLTSRAPTAGGITTAVTLITFVLDVIPFLANSALAWLNPWHHYFPQAIVAAVLKHLIPPGDLSLQDAVDEPVGVGLALDGEWPQCEAIRTSD